MIPAQESQHEVAFEYVLGRLARLTSVLNKLTIVTTSDNYESCATRAVGNLERVAHSPFEVKNYFRDAVGNMFATKEKTGDRTYGPSGQASDGSDYKPFPRNCLK